MQRFTAAVLFATASLAVAAPPEEDRRAILAMAGNFKVTFDFKETAAITPGYTPGKPYHEEAVEMVAVAEDRPERITLQHVLVVREKPEDAPHIIKHWAQIWTWEDTRILDYAGSDGVDVWKRHVVDAAAAKGKGKPGRGIREPRSPKRSGTFG